MPRQKAGTKAYSALDLLTALYEPRVRAALEPYGFTEANLEQGWALLRAYGRARRAPPPPFDPEGVLKQLEEWETHWFVLCDVATAREFPEVNAWLFHNLSRTRGRDLLANVQVLVDRIRKLRGARAKGAKAAAQRLRERGVSEVVLGEVDALFARLQQFKSRGGSYDPDAGKKESAAEADLWAWYLEWSSIARLALRDDKQLLNHLGFGKVGRPRGSKKKRAKNKE